MLSIGSRLRLSASLVGSGSRAVLHFSSRFRIRVTALIINFPIIFRISTHSWLRAYINFRHPFIMRFVARRESFLSPFILSFTLQSECSQNAGIVVLFSRYSAAIRDFHSINTRVGNYSIVEITLDPPVAIFHPARYILRHRVNKLFYNSFIIISLLAFVSRTQKYLTFDTALFLHFFSFLYSIKSHVVNEILLSTFFSET